MDPQVISLLTTIGMTLSTSIAAWAASNGWIKAADQVPMADIIVTLVGAVITAGLGWYKTQQHGQKAMIQAINAGDNGVKVVAESSPAAVVNEPLKGVK